MQCKHKKSSRATLKIGEFGNQLSASAASKGRKLANTLFTSCKAHWPLKPSQIKKLGKPTLRTKIWFPDVEICGASVAACNSDV